MDELCGQEGEVTYINKISLSNLNICYTCIIDSYIEEFEQYYYKITRNLEIKNFDLNNST